MSLKETIGRTAGIIARISFVSSIITSGASSSLSLHNIDINEERKVFHDLAIRQEERGGSNTCGSDYFGVCVQIYEAQSKDLSRQSLNYLYCTSATILLYLTAGIVKDVNDRYQ